MKKQVRRDAFDAEALNRQIGKKLDKVKLTMNNIVAEVADLHSILDSDQKEKLRDLIGDWGDRRHSRHRSNFCSKVDA
jgi:hypothetical protein